MKEIEELNPADCFIKPIDFNKLKLTLDSISQKSKKHLKQGKDK